MHAQNVSFSHMTESHNESNEIGRKGILSMREVPTWKP